MEYYCMMVSCDCGTLHLPPTSISRDTDSPGNTPLKASRILCTSTTPYSIIEIGVTCIAALKILFLTRFEEKKNSSSC